MWWCSHRWQSGHDKLPWWDFSCLDTWGGIESSRRKVERWGCLWHQGEQLCKTALFHHSLYFGGQHHFSIHYWEKYIGNHGSLCNYWNNSGKPSFLRRIQNLMWDRLYSVDWILYCSLKAQPVTNIRSDYIVKSQLLLFLVGNTSFC